MRAMHESTTSSPAPRLAELLKKAGLKRHELAVEMGVDPSTIYRWERYGPPRDEIPRLALRFGVTPEYLMGWDAEAA